MDKKTAPCSLGLSWMLLRTRTLNFSQDCCRRRCPRALFPIVEGNGREREAKKEKWHAVERERCDETRPPFDQFLGITWDVFRNIAFTYLWLRWKVPEEAARSLAPPSCFESFERWREGGREGGGRVIPCGESGVGTALGRNKFRGRTEVLIFGKLLVKFTVHP